jgi:hypothetical protein
LPGQAAWNNVAWPLLQLILGALGASGVTYFIVAWLIPWLTGRRTPPVPPILWRRFALLVSLMGGLAFAAPQAGPILFPAHHLCPASATSGAVDWTAPIAGGQGAVPYEQVGQPVGPCQTLMLTGREFVGPDGTPCQGSTTQVCVLLESATYAQTVRITGLEPNHSWYGVTSSDKTAALVWQAPNFWTTANCESGHGCDSAAVYEYLDSELVDHFDLVPNGGIGP